jgi:hypothetical protein
VLSPLRQRPSSHMPVFLNASRARDHEGHMDMCFWPKSAPVDPIIAFVVRKKTELTWSGCYENGGWSGPDRWGGLPTMWDDGDEMSPSTEPDDKRTLMVSQLLAQSG